MGSQKHPRVLSIFDGYSAALIAEWCAVSIKTATLYKSNWRKPSRQALRVFVLHRDGRVLSDVWRDCCVRGDRLIDPEDQGVTLGQLRAYWIVMQLAAEYARRRSQVHALARRAGAARRASHHPLASSMHPTRTTPAPCAAGSVWHRRAMDGPPQKDTGTCRDAKRRPTCPGAVAREARLSLEIATLELHSLIAAGRSQAH